MPMHSMTVTLTRCCTRRAARCPAWRRGWVWWERRCSRDLLSSAAQAEGDCVCYPVQWHVRSLVHLPCDVLVGRFDEREDDLVGGHEDGADVLHRDAFGR